MITKVSLCCLFLFMGFTNMDIQINDYFYKANSITIYNNNIISEFESDSDEFNNILNELINTCQDSHEMPAFGVSLHNDTIEAIKSGLWIELNFNQLKHREMPFDSLLIQVVEDYTGMNIIRKWNGEYSGRCYYIDINNNMSSLYNCLKKYT